MLVFVQTTVAELWWFTVQEPACSRLFCFLDFAVLLFRDSLFDFDLDLSNLFNIRSVQTCERLLSPMMQRIVVSVMFFSFVHHFVAACLKHYQVLVLFRYSLCGRQQGHMLDVVSAIFIIRIVLSPSVFQHEWLIHRDTKVMTRCRREECWSCWSFARYEVLGARRVLQVVIAVAFRAFLEIRCNLFSSLLFKVDSG